MKVRRCTAGDLQGKEIKKGRSQKIEECYIGCILALQNEAKKWQTR